MTQTLKVGRGRHLRCRKDGRGRVQRPRRFPLRVIAARIGTHDEHLVFPETYAKFAAWIRAETIARILWVTTVRVSSALRDVRNSMLGIKQTHEFAEEAAAQGNYVQRSPIRDRGTTSSARVAIIPEQCSFGGRLGQTARFLFGGSAVGDSTRAAS